MQYNLVEHLEQMIDDRVENAASQMCNRETSRRTLEWVELEKLTAALTKLMDELP